MTQSAEVKLRILHFTIGPVQGFVAEARRTRDLWAGSFLLSWLAGQAMSAVVTAGGSIVLPDIRADPLIRAIRTRPGGFGPAVGSLPNRFKARVPADFDAAACRAAIDAAWRGLADRVWQRFVAQVVQNGCGTQAIWDRQVGGFWDTAWVIGDDPGDRSDQAWLDRRKNWRTYRPPVEGGDHCTLMGDWQELSGFVRARERTAQDAFWTAIREQLTNPLDLDAQGRERLCAMALIKRLFLEVAEEAVGWLPSWYRQEVVRWPSTPRLAAAGWLGHAWRSAQAEAEVFVRVIEGTQRSRIEPPLAKDNTLSRVAGQFLHRSSIETARPEELGDADRKRLLDTWDALKQAAGRPPSPFYALLLMDGDSVGKLLRAYPEATVAEALGAFTFNVEQESVSPRGFLVYAGGDDVLALLPIEDALAAAIKLRCVYRTAFKAAGIPDATTSAALVFAHFHVPLRQVLRQAHKQLENAAKDGNGRDSLAVCVFSQSGMLLQWVSAWSPQEAREPPANLLNRRASSLAGSVPGRFFYKLRATWGNILALRQSGEEEGFSEDEVRGILLAEYLNGEMDAAARANAETLIEDILSLARHWPGSTLQMPVSASLNFDGPLLARFLGQERVPL